MESLLFAGISHKGGTGRSVSMANVAYRLARRGYPTCCVDLDLASPTFGSVLGLPGYATGDVETDVDRPSVHHLIARPEIATKAPQGLRNVWESDDLRGDISKSRGAFCLLPGNIGVGDRFGATELPEPLSDIFWSLSKAGFVFIFADLRSGISNVVKAFADPKLGEMLTAWLVFHRWTRQHLHGAQELVEGLTRSTDAKILRVGTAHVDPNSAGETPNKTWLMAQHKSMSRQEAEIAALGSARIGSVPHEPMLQWVERIVMDQDVKDGVARQETVDAYDDLASYFASMVER